MATFVLTQPEGRTPSLLLALESHGHECVPLPFSRLVANAAEQARLARVDPGAFDRLIFVSPAAVGFAAPVLAKAFQGHAGFCAIGVGTQAALHDTEIQSRDGKALMPTMPPYDADALLPLLLASTAARVAVIKGQGGRTDWINALRQSGVSVDEFALYASRPCTPALDQRDRLSAALERGSPMMSLISSRPAIAALVRWRPVAPMLAALMAKPAMLVHPNVLAVARQLGFTDCRLPVGDQTLVSAALEWAAESAA